MSEQLARSEIVARAIAIEDGMERGDGKPRATAKEIHAAMEGLRALRLHPGITPEEDRYLRDMLETFGGMHARCEEREEREAAAALHEQLRQKLRQRRQQRRQSKP